MSQQPSPTRKIPSPPRRATSFEPLAATAFGEVIRAERLKQAIAQVNPAIAGFEASCFDAQYITGDTSDEPRTHCQQPVSADGEDDGELVSLS